MESGLSLRWYSCRKHVKVFHDRYNRAVLTRKNLPFKHATTAWDDLAKISVIVYHMVTRQSTAWQTIRRRRGNKVLKSPRV